MTRLVMNVLLVEDEPPIRRFLKSSLAVHNFRVAEAETGARALDLLRLGQIPGPGAPDPRASDIVIMDLGLPDIDGLELIGRIRASSKLPIIVLSCRSDERSIVQALELGANDYVRKPFGLGELVARLDTALRHRFYEKGEEPVFRCGVLSIDLVHRKVTRDGSLLKLSPIEFSLLQLLVTHAGKVLTHDQILRAVWGRSDAEIQHIRTYVRQLRKKLEPDPEFPVHILTESGVGYRFQSPEYRDR